MLQLGESTKTWTWCCGPTWIACHGNVVVGATTHLGLSNATQHDVLGVTFSKLFVDEYIISDARIECENAITIVIV